jgi:phthalate 4,5-dioxygenase oxygenase subunit
MTSRARLEPGARVEPGKASRHDERGTEPPDHARRLLSSYWQPAALLDELDGPRPLKALRLMGRDLILFRDEAGRLGLIDRDCAHRNADLAYGRLEDGGLRCPFHGWLFDVEGKCLDTPAEPTGSRLCENIRQRSYPVVARSGIAWAYLGDGEAPAFPAFDCFIAPDTHVFRELQLADHQGAARISAPRHRC